MSETTIISVIGCSALQASCLSVHILNDNIMDFAERRAVFKHLPRLVGMIVDFNKLFVTDGKKAVALKIFNEIIKGTDSRKEFFNKIIDVVTLLGGDLNDAL